eukprot:scaffold14195_cov155-Skeletonema_dohrnii-CCMP3373.AAC.23
MRREVDRMNEVFPYTLADAAFKTAEISQIRFFLCRLEHYRSRLLKEATKVLTCFMDSNRDERERGRLDSIVLRCLPTSPLQPPFPAPSLGGSSSSLASVYSSRPHLVIAASAEATDDTTAIACVVLQLTRYQSCCALHIHQHFQS